MSDDPLIDLEARLDAVTTALLPALRATKVILRDPFEELLNVARELASALDATSVVPKHLVGKLWFVFTAMLAEADHTRDPGPILEAAWAYEGRLKRIFGPHF